MPEIHVDIAANESCKNPWDSYGEICIRCNCCGRFDKKTMWECRAHTYKRHINENLEKLLNKGYWTELQQTNLASNIVYLANMFKEAVKHIDFEKEVNEND